MGKLIGVIFKNRYYSLESEEGQAAYCRAVAEVAARRSQLPCPAIHTDTNFFRGDDDGFRKNQRMRELYYTNAHAAGIDTAGKRYMPELVKPGLQCGRDEAAWVPQTQGRSHIKSVLRKRRWSSEGRVEVSAPSYDIPDDPEPYVPAEDIVEKATQMDIENHGLKKVSAQERAKLKAANAKLLAGNMNDR